MCMCVCMCVYVVNLQADNQMGHHVLIKVTPDKRTGYDRDLQSALEPVSGDLQVSRVQLNSGSAE